MKAVGDQAEQGMGGRSWEWSRDGAWEGLFPFHWSHDGETESSVGLGGKD